jgi:hypothetical protein
MGEHFMSKRLILAAAFLLSGFSAMARADINLSLGDSITLGGTRVTCGGDGGGNGGSCNERPRTDCDSWEETGIWQCRDTSGGDSGDKWYKSTRSCRSFDSCGRLSGTYTETNWGKHNGCGMSSSECCTLGH